MMFDFEVAMGLEKIETFSPQMNADEHRWVKKVGAGPDNTLKVLSG